MTHFVYFHAQEEGAIVFNIKLLVHSVRLPGCTINGRRASGGMDVIEKPEVAQALRQDKNQNLQYLKEHFNVRLACSSVITEYLTLLFESLLL